MKIKRVNGQLESLGQQHFVTEGGEGAIYTKAGVGFKIYHSPENCISASKVLELSHVNEPNFLRPLSRIWNLRGDPIGYEMQFVDQTVSLTRLISNGFKKKHRLDTTQIYQILMQISELMNRVHAKSIHIVDLHSDNILISRDFQTVYFVDVDSYQTPMHPATAQLDLIRDPLATSWNEKSDRYAFAILAVQLLMGIHPFKGKHPQIKGIKNRMQAGISVFHSSVSLPPSCFLPSSIEPVLRQWFIDTLEKGQRAPVPQRVLSQRTVFTQPSADPVLSQRVQSRALCDVEESILLHAYQGGRRILVGPEYCFIDGVKHCPTPGIPLSIVANPSPILVFKDGGTLGIFDIAGQRKIESSCAFQEMDCSGNRMYGVLGDKLVQLTFHQTGAGIWLSYQVVSTVMRYASSLFEGVLIQNILGSMYVSLLRGRDGVVQVLVPELKGAKIVEARFRHRLLIVNRLERGVYRQDTILFSADFCSYDYQTAVTESFESLNFVAMPNGVSVHLLYDGRLVLRSPMRGEASKRIEDTGLSGKESLFVEERLLCAKGTVLHRLRMANP
ncbi:MAG: hypothetical protein VX278_11690 [Myxococcota bacterium]|nr:hypothetical protein [Myxococcota bacterium]